MSSSEKKRGCIYLFTQLTLSFLSVVFDFNPSPSAVAPAFPILLPVESMEKNNADE